MVKNAWVSNDALHQEGNADRSIVRDAGANNGGPMHSLLELIPGRISTLLITQCWLSK